MVEKDFRWRGTEMTRAEAFSDAVFAFAVTLLVVALEVPHSFSDLMQAVRGFGGFAVCFALLVLVWSKHTDYFRRYGLQTTWSIFLNCSLLFLVLFYVYPLKFLFGLLFGMMLHGRVPEITQALPTMARNAFSSGIATGGMCALLMNIVLPGERQ